MIDLAHPQHPTHTLSLSSLFSSPSLPLPSPSSTQSALTVKGEHQSQEHGKRIPPAGFQRGGGPQAATCQTRLRFSQPLHHPITNGQTFRRVARRARAVCHALLQHSAHRSVQGACVVSDQTHIAQRDRPAKRISCHTHHALSIRPKESPLTLLFPSVHRISCPCLRHHSSLSLLTLDSDSIPPGPSFLRAFGCCCVSHS